MLARPIRAFAYGIRHFAGLAHAIADLAMIVADDHDSPKAEAPAALDDLGRAGNMDHTLVELFALFLVTPPPAHLCFPLPLSLLAWHQSS